MVKFLESYFGDRDLILARLQSKVERKMLSPLTACTYPYAWQLSSLIDSGYGIHIPAVPGTPTLTQIISAIMLVGCNNCGHATARATEPPGASYPCTVHRNLAQEQTVSLKEVHTLKYVAKNVVT
jgi:hypothetical protein